LVEGGNNLLNAGGVGQTHSYVSLQVVHAGGDTTQREGGRIRKGRIVLRGRKEQGIFWAIIVQDKVVRSAKNHNPGEPSAKFSKGRTTDCDTGTKGKENSTRGGGKEVKKVGEERLKSRGTTNRLTRGKNREARDNRRIIKRYKKNRGRKTE